MNRVTCSCLDPSHMSDSDRVSEHALLRHCTIIQSSPFLRRIYEEDISPCLKFSRGEELQRGVGVQIKDEKDIRVSEDDLQNKIEEDLERAIHYNELVIEPVTSIERLVLFNIYIYNIYTYIY